MNLIALGTLGSVFVTVSTMFFQAPAACDFHDSGSQGAH